MTKTDNLFSKLVRVMQGVERVPKRGYNSFHKYNYVMEADLIDSLKKLLSEENVFIFSSVESVAKEQTITTVTVRYTMVNGDSPEDKFEVCSSGQGQDSGDKGVYKAITGAMKYFLMKNFLIPTGDDPEDDGGVLSVPEKTAKIEKTPVKSNQKTIDEAIDEVSPKKLGAKDLAFIKPITNLLKNCATQEELDAAIGAAKDAKSTMKAEHVDYIKELIAEAKARING